MDLFNRPPSVAEDTIAYELYPTATSAQKDAVAALATVIREWVDAQLPGHIWHRDAFELKVVQNQHVQDAQQWMLEGRMRVGDCVDDEWLVVWLLRQVSRQWDVVVSVFDTDGEFLLIEAADAPLPSWVTPTNAENRVWIYQTNLHLIPLSHVSPSSSKPRRSRYFRMRDSDDEGEEEETRDYLSVSDALRLVRSAEVHTIADPPVQQDAFRRTANYPGLARQHVHAARMHLPVDVARALSANPSLVQKAAEAFYTRDALQLRAANRMSRFPPEPSVVTTVKMSRTAYAQLVGQKFYPPKPFGRWSEAQETPEWRRRDVGMKIACGFEMLYQESKGRSEFSAGGLSTSTSSDAARLDALRRNAEYQKYIRNLVANGYFQGQLEGSQLWSQLEERAARVFGESLRNDDASRPSFAALVNGALGTVDEGVFAAAQATGEEDSDSWLNVDEGDVDVIMEERSGGASRAHGADSDAMHVDGKPQRVQSGSGEAADPAVEAAADRLQRLARKVEKFVDGRGDVEGALFDDEHISDGDSDGASEMQFSDDGSDIGKESVDSETARQEAMDKLVPPLEAGEYGKMPASYYETSQRVAPTTIDDEVVEEPAVAEPPRDTDEAQNTLSNAQTTESRPVRGPILPRDKWDGVDSDDETDEEELHGDLGPLPDEDEEEEDDRPQVVGEVEIDMEEEQEEFLQFAREALGISDEMWRGIVRDRLDKGAYVPAGDRSSPSADPQSRSPSSSSRPSKIPDTSRISHGSPAADATTAAAPAGSPAGGLELPDSRPKEASRRLDTFESVMDAMDEELARARNLRDRRASSSLGPAGGNSSASNKARGSASGDSKGKERAVEEVEDIEAAMDAELQASLLHAGEDEDEDGDAPEPGDYAMIKNFLESFKAQGGLAGPVSSLAGRLEPGWRLPRDEQ
ncbi:SGT1-domain-containing protein [Exidia glandulosa HHB12029]|uniref:SGT1-domain-containing protein n=1 Tax=Exidia glandulosa HHB12029 TaxID=1314781 RepID=A0A165PFL8_EXIGL|nr:SGT1-domain-containing protein [Exidia glandulosa HHB12029]